MDSIALASVYRLTGVNFWQSAKIISENIKKKNNGSPDSLLIMPFYFLVSQSIELFLKSALLKRGFTDNDLRKRDYRHNLKKLLDELQKKNIHVTPATVQIIHKLSTHHNSHILRYNFVTGIDGVTSLPIELMLNTLEELLMLTRIATQGR